MSSVSLRRVAPESIKGANQFSLTDDVRATVTPIVNAVKSGGKSALIDYEIACSMKFELGCKNFKLLRGN